MSYKEDLLPTISVKVNVAPFRFVEQLGEIAKGIDDLDVRERFETESINLSVKFTLPAHTTLEELVASFTTRERSTDRVFVKLLSKSWAECGPTYEEYVALAVNHLKPLLSAYNEKYRTNRRLRIPKKCNLEPKLSPGLDAFFKKFAKEANKSMLHPSSWSQFYTFINSNHTLRTTFSSDDLERLLFAEGFSDYYIEKLSCIYHHGRAILSNDIYPPRRITEQYWAQKNKEQET